MSKILPLASVLAAAALITACGDDGGGMDGDAATAKATTEINISNFLYVPTPATVKAGTKVAVANADSAPHTVTDKGSGRTFDSGTIKGKRSGSVTFSKAGTYAYFCEFHPTMAGKVTVTE